MRCEAENGVSFRPPNTVASERTYSVFRSSILVFQPFANVPVTNTSLGPLATPSTTPCPSSFFHLINVGTPSLPAPRSTAAASKLAAIVAEGTDNRGMGIAARGALKRFGGRRTAGEMRMAGLLGVYGGEGEGMTPVPEGIESTAMGSALDGTRGARTLSMGGWEGGYGGEVCGGRSWGALVAG